MNFHLLLFYLKHQNNQLPKELIHQIISYYEINLTEYLLEKHQKQIMYLNCKSLITKIKFLEKSCIKHGVIPIFLSIQPIQNKFFKQFLKKHYLPSVLNNPFTMVVSFSSSSKKPQDQKQYFNLEESTSIDYYHNYSTIKFYNELDRAFYIYDNQLYVNMTMRIMKELYNKFTSYYPFGDGEILNLNEFEKNYKSYFKNWICYNDPLSYEEEEDSDDSDNSDNEFIYILIDNPTELKKYCLKNINLNKNIKTGLPHSYLSSIIINNYGLSEYPITVWKKI